MNWWKSKPVGAHVGVLAPAESISGDYSQAVAHMPEDKQSMNKNISTSSCLEFTIKRKKKKLHQKYWQQWTVIIASKA